MKKISIFGIVLSSLIFPGIARGQATEIQQLILNWEKLRQLEEILDNMYKGYKILDYGYSTIKNISEGNFKLHQVFLDGLMAVNPTVRNYRRIPSIVNYQKLLVKEYKRAYDRFERDPNFNPDELQYLASVYKFLIDQSLENLDGLVMIVTASKLRMSDDERLAAIDRIFFDMQGKLLFVRYFNNNTQMLAIQRAREAGDVSTMKSLYEVHK